MDDFPGILARDFGFRPQGKSAPMAASTASSAGGGASNLGFGSGGSPAANGFWGKSRSGWNSNSAGDPWLGEHGVGISEGRTPPAYDDVFGGPTRPSNPSSHGRSASSSPPPAFDSIFDGYNKDAGPKPSSSSSFPVYDKPIYDDDIFVGVPGVKSSSSFKYDDVFTSMSSGSNHVSSPPYEDLLENLGKPMPESKGASGRRSVEEKDQDLSGFDDLIPGFGRSSPPKKREFPEANKQKPAVSSAKAPASTTEDPFVVLESESRSTYSSSGIFTDPLEHIKKPVNFGSTKVDASSINGGIPGDNNAFNGVSESEPFFATGTNEGRRGKSPLKSAGHGKQSPSRSQVDAFENILPSMQTSKPSDSHASGGRSGFHSSETIGRNISGDQSPKSNEQRDTADDVWLTVDEIPLFTQSTTAPPPSRPPPPLVIKQASFGATHNYTYHNESARNSVVSPIDELEDFAMGKPQTHAQDHSDTFTGEEETETNSAAAASAAAMKEAMDRAEAKFKHAKEVRERERDAKFAKNRESMHQEDLEDNDKQERLNWEQEQKEREYREKERKRLEKEREQDLVRERERNRQAVERATREARERAAAEARLKSEKAAVEKANTEARQRAERAAVQRAAAEARERAEKEARERAAAESREKASVAARERATAEVREKAAAEARERAAVERAAAEARRRAERAAVERAAAEARERAAADARERAAAAAREKQQNPEDDLESFFGMGARANSAPKERATSSETMFDAQAQNKGGFDGARRASSTVRKASSTANFADDLVSIFGGPPSSGEFQEIDGESEERRRARFERHQRTRERAAKALAEKNERDMQTQREQAERHRIAESLDIEIKRWASGKESNLRAMLSTLQYVLWPECGWQPVSLTDLITAAAVKKVYRKATLCIHPDKVQQKGATLQQKYIAEKVFDLLKESWNKFNSEELF